MKRAAFPAILIVAAGLIGSCSSFAYLFSDDYLQAGIGVTTLPADVVNLHMVNQWSTEFITTYSAQDVGAWAANRLAKEGRHDLLVFVELISAYDSVGKDIRQSENMWRISVYKASGRTDAKGGA